MNQHIFERYILEDDFLNHLPLICNHLDHLNF